MTGLQIAALVVVFVAVDLFVIALVLRTLSPNDLAAKHPPVAPAPGAVRRQFQSFSFGMLNLGGCIHVAVDEHHLHLDPAWFARVLVRMRPMSIPWDAIRLVKAAKGLRRSTHVRISSVDVRGPSWCLEMANRP